MTPDAPGWWWRMGNRGPVVRLVDRDVHGRLIHHGIADPMCAALHDDGRWLGPVAPPGFIPPAEHARAVRGTRTAAQGPWAGSSARRALIATLTRHGTPQAEAERLADGVQETTP